MVGASPTGVGMTDVAAGWFPDPLGRYEHRYWDGSAWTAHVAHGGQQATDEIAGTTTPSETAVDRVEPVVDAVEPTISEPTISEPVIPEPAAAETSFPPSTDRAPAQAAPPPRPVFAAAPYQAPQSSVPPPGAYTPPPPVYMTAPVQASVAGLAIASMVLGIVWIYWIGSILAIIFGHVALVQIRKSNGWKTGRGMAIAGLTLGYIGLATLVLVIIIAVTSANTVRTRFNINTDGSNGVCNPHRVLEDPDC